MRRRLGAGARRVDRLAAPGDDRLVEGILHVGREVRRAEDAGGVRLVPGEQQIRGDTARPGVDREPVHSQRGVPGPQPVGGVGFDRRLFPVPFSVTAPRPGVAEPERRQDVDRRRLRPAVGDGEPDEQVVGGALGVLGDDVEVAIPLKRAGVGDLELPLIAPAPAVLAQKRRVRELPLRVLVERLHVGVRRRRVEVEVRLLHVLAVIPLGAGEPEEPLLEDRIAPVPQGEREAQAALPVGDAEQTVLPPAVGAAARLVVGEILPAGAVGGVVLAHRAPLALAEIRPPAFPVLRPRRVLREPQALGIGRGIVRAAHGEDARRKITVSFAAKGGFMTFASISPSFMQPGRCRGSASRSSGHPTISSCTS